MRMKTATMLAAVWAAGCTRQGPALNTNAFVAPPPPGGASAMTHQEVGHGTGQLQPNNSVAVNQAPDKIDPVVAEEVRPPGETAQVPVTQPATQAATQPGRSSGQYLTLGGVMCEVNSKPVFANTVLALVDRDLQAKATTLSEEEFKTYANQKVGENTQALIRDELEFAAAQTELGPDDQRLAMTLTTAWRQHKIIEAGGSLEMARRKAQADGESFEELADRQYRTYMRQIFYQKKFVPRIEIRADDMREYYRQHVDKEFTERQAARFRLIKITAAATGSLEAAFEKIKSIHERAAKGEDFEKLAAAFNDEPRLLASAGDVGWIDRHAYRDEKIEEAVWKLEVKDITDIMRVGDAYFIAKLEDRKKGRVRPFEEEAVQDAIRKELHRKQFIAQRDIVQKTLLKQAVVTPYPPNLNPAMDMVMQMYPRWKQVAPAGPPVPAR